MKLGNYTFKRKYSLIQVIVDIASGLALIYLFFMFFACASDIEATKALNSTEASLDFLKWEPLLVWCVLAVVIFGISTALLFIPKKMPEKCVVPEKYANKYCNIVDSCNSCLRLMCMLILSEICYMHMQAIMLRDVMLSVQLLLQIVISVLLIWFTAVRLDGLYNIISDEQEIKEKRTIIED